MAKTKTAFFCNACGHESSKWLGRCPACEAWNSFVEEVVSKTSKTVLVANNSKVTNIMDVAGDRNHRVLTGINELDKVLGGGFVAGAFMLLGGDPGIGKSTLAMQLAMRLSVAGHKVLYVSGEESADQIKMRVLRLGECGNNLLLYTATSIEDILLQVVEIKPALVIVDSIQTMYAQDIASAPGSVSQVRECAGKLLRMAKETDISVLAVGHITKDGQIAGPKILEHMVDVVLYFEGERNYNFRIIRAQKNRFGSINESGIFSMESDGLAEVKNPSEILLQGRSAAHAGSIVTPYVEGNRALLLEVQSLVCQSYYGMPRRLVTGYDYNRLIMILAVLERRCGMVFGQLDVFLNVIGGIKIDEPAADLAVALAVLSSQKSSAIGVETAAFGEIGLTGEIRAVPHAESRIKEAVALGFSRVILPSSCKSSCKKITDVELVFVADIHELLDRMF